MKTQYNSYFCLAFLSFSMLLLFQSCNNKGKGGHDNPQTAVKLDTISVAQAKILWTNFDNHIKSQFPIDTVERANNAWFSIESLENYIAYAKQQAATQNQSLSGIRIYFGKHELASGHENDFYTVFLSPTIKRNLDNKNLKSTDGGSATQSSTDPADDPDMGVPLENYGSAGRPPKKEFPY